MTTSQQQAPVSYDLVELLGNDLLSKRADGEKAPAQVAQLQGKYVGLYFSASWCPPCRQFTPMLRETYKRLQAEGKQFEVVFISSDKNLSQWENYFDEMPWLAVPYGAESRRHNVARQFGVMGIPQLVILNPEGHVINTNARSAIMKDREGLEFPWAGVEETRSPVKLPHQLLMFLIAWIVVRYVLSLFSPKAPVG